MTRRTHFPLLAFALAVLALLGLAVPVAAAPPRQHDYLRIARLSTPVHRTVHEVVRVPMPDGTAIYLEVTRPAGGGRHPVILEASPYHGTLADRHGTRILPDPTDPGTGDKLGLTGYFGPRGYAVVMMDLRGTGRSQGCLDHLGPKDGDDLKRIVEWAASQRWSTGRVGMTGHSYVAATTVVAAAQRPRGLVTIVPSAGLSSMYDHQFQAGVPYNLQWVGPMFAYEQLAIDRSLPRTSIPNPTGGTVGSGDNVGNDPHQTGCGAPSSSLTAGESQLSGQYVDWHRIRDWSAAAAASPVSVFMVHGVNDDAARVTAMAWFTRRGGRAGDKMWLGQWSHGVGCCPTRRGAQWTGALHAWFDRTLQQRKVDTGPAVEAFLADGSLTQVRNGARNEVLESGAWPPKSTDHRLSTRAPGTLGPDGGDKPGEVSFGASNVSGGGVDFTTQPATADRWFVGQPKLTLVASVTAPRVHLIANVFDQDQDGARRRITQFAINPELREGIDRLTPVVPGQRYVLRPPGFAMAHHLRPGHRLVLRVSTTDPDKVPTFANDPKITVFTGPGGTTVSLPVLERPRVLRDQVPL